jgi:predicted transcriptional regulator
VRFLIVRLLAERQLTSAQIAKTLARKQSTVSNHLASLRKLDVVGFKRTDNGLVYWLKLPELCRLLDAAERCVSRVEELSARSARARARKAPV